MFEILGILLSRPRCTPAALDSHPRGLSDYSLVKEQSRSSVTLASRRSSRLTGSLNVERNFRYRRRVDPTSVAIWRAGGESYRASIGCQPPSLEIFARRAIHQETRVRPLVGQPVVTGVADFATCSRHLLERAAVQVTAADAGRGFEPSDDRRIMWRIPPGVKARTPECSPLRCADKRYTSILPAGSSAVWRSGVRNRLSVAALSGCVGPSSRLESPHLKGRIGSCQTYAVASAAGS
jgi:hypothetical protein